MGDLTGFNYWVGRRENSSRSLGQYPEVSGWTGTVVLVAPQGGARTLFHGPHKRAQIQLWWHAQTGMNRLESGMLCIRFSEPSVILC